MLRPWPWPWRLGGPAGDVGARSTTIYAGARSRRSAGRQRHAGMHAAPILGMRMGGPLMTSCRLTAEHGGVRLHRLDSGIRGDGDGAGTIHVSATRGASLLCSTRTTCLRGFDGPCRLASNRPRHRPPRILFSWLSDGVRTESRSFLYVPRQK
ncbi:hypothetical protein D1007_16090 [Hordeum vulgare]|nr:hypothetical protein D1007_16090 [Hordeum vulgare]